MDKEKTKEINKTVDQYEFEKNMNRIIRESEYSEGWIYKLQGEYWFVINETRYEGTN